MNADIGGDNTANEKTAVPVSDADAAALRARKKKYNLLIAACVFLYASSIASKSVFTAEIVKVLDVLNVTKVQASLANTYYFITYALLQVGLTFFIGRINVKKYLVFTLPVSAIVCVAIPFVTGIEGIWVLFAVNGLAQAGLWGGCVLILSKYLPFDFLSKANKLLTLGMVFGSTFANGVAAGAVAVDAWQLGFIITGVIFGVSIIFFAVVVFSFKGQGAAKEYTVNVKKEKPLFILSSKKSKVAFYAYSCVVGFLSSSLYYAVYNWLSTYFKDVWGMPDSYAILLTVVFPIVMAAGPVMGISYCDKHPNFIKAEIIFLIVPLAISVAMIFIFGWNLVAAIALLVVYIVLIKSVTAVYSGVAAFNMRSQINSGSYSALTNSFASLSAGITPTIIGELIERYGYGTQFTATTVIAGVLMAVLVIYYFCTRKKALAQY